MLNFDKENKITFEQLSFSLQDRLRKIVPKSEIKKVKDILDLCEQSLNGVRFSCVSDLNDISIPVNNCDVAILTEPALTLYVYSDNRWIKIPNQDIFYRFTVNQSENQLITITANDKNYTSSINLSYGTTWSATIKSTSNYYKAGTLNKNSGIITEEDSISATPATLITDFYLNMVVGKHQTKDEYGVRLNWSDSIPDTELYGSMEPEMFDFFGITKKSDGTYSSRINFYSNIPTDPMYDRITINLIYNEVAHNILNNFDLSNFNETGDLSNTPTFTNQYFYDLFKSLKGKRAQVHVHFIKD